MYGILYVQLYGKTDVMARTKRLELRLSEQEYERLQSWANYRGISMGEILRDYIKSLPEKEQS